MQCSALYYLATGREKIKFESQPESHIDLKKHKY